VGSVAAASSGVRRRDLVNIRGLETLPLTVR
jgi:hypothetical protein